VIVTAMNVVIAMISMMTYVIRKKVSVKMEKMGKMAKMVKMVKMDAKVQEDRQDLVVKKVKKEHVLKFVINLYINNVHVIILVKKPVHIYGQSKIIQNQKYL
jgi:hypothetical protein